MKRREAVIREKYAALAAHLTERGRRIWAATEAKSYGRGGIAAVYRATGITDKTIRRGIRELRGGQGTEAGRIRQVGGGRKRLTEQDHTLVQDLERLVDPVTRGDPESPLLWTSKSTYHLSEALQHQGHQISQRSGYNWLRESGYTLQANGKRDEGASHQDRNEQLNISIRRCKAFSRRDNLSSRWMPRRRKTLAISRMPGPNTIGPARRRRCGSMIFSIRGAAKPFPTGCMTWPKIKAG